MVCKYPMKIQEYMDLCTVANVSVFVLEDDLHGYYLHGRAPENISEGNT